MYALRKGMPAFDTTDTSTELDIVILTAPVVFSSTEIDQALSQPAHGIGLKPSTERHIVLFTTLERLSPI